MKRPACILLCPMQFVHALYVAIVPFLRNKKICNSLHGLVVLYSMEPWSQADHILCSCYNSISIEEGV